MYIMPLQMNFLASLTLNQYAAVFVGYLVGRTNDPADAMFFVTTTLHDKS